MKRAAPVFLASFALCLAPASQAAADRRSATPVHARISLTGVFYTEHELGVPPGVQPVLASPTDLLFGDLRLQLSATQLGKRVDLLFDVRERFTGSFDFERKFTGAYSTTPLDDRSGLSARGYLGGPEHDLRQAWIGLRIGAQSRLVLGRMIISEADALKIDGGQIRVPWGAHWIVSAFFGASPNPYSRSLLSDYVAPCGAGVASGNAVLDLSSLERGRPPALIAPDPCRLARPLLSLAGGVAARYRYHRFAGQLSLVGAGFGGPGDGGVVGLDFTRPANQVGTLRPASTRRDSARIYLNWQNQLPQLGPVDGFTDLVIDLQGSHGPQLTRALALVNLRLLPKQRLTLRATYSYLSPIAIDQFLRQQLYNRAPNGTTLDPRGGAGVVENNLTVLRTARQEARLGLDAILYKHVSFWAEGRFRGRSLRDGARNPLVFQVPLYTEQVRSVAYDATLGVRDSGSLSKLQLAASYTFLHDFRAQNHLFRVSLGRDLARERVTLGGDYLLLATRDAGLGQSACARNLDPPLGQDLLAALDPTRSVFAADCFGRRRGLVHELGVSVTAMPWRRLVILVDYHVALMQTDPQAGQAIPSLLGHTLWARFEVSF